MNQLKQKISRRLERIKTMLRQRNRNPLDLFLYVIRLQYRRKFLFTEVHDYELDIRGKAYEESFLNCDEQKRYLEVLNPRKYYTLARNKFLTHVLLDKVGIKNKATLICYYNPEMGITTHNITRDLSQVISVMKDSGITQFVIKTTESSHGDNVWVIKNIIFKHNDAILERFDGKEILLSSILKEEPLLFETLVVQTDQMSSLNSSSVNTIRFMTTLFPNGEAKTIAAFIKIGRAGNCVDNAGSGGNVDGAVDIETGRIFNVIEFRGWRQNRPVKRHPDTNAEVENVMIENWSEIRKKVEEYQKSIPFVKAAGWDIALTSEGPYVIEVNDMWDRTGQLFIGRGWKKEIKECYDAWVNYYKKQ